MKRLLLTRAGWLGLTVLVALGMLGAVRGSDAPDEFRNGRLVLHVTDDAGRPIPFRARTVPRTFQARVLPGLSVASIVTAIDGRAELTLPAGEHRLIVSRGPAWSMVELPLNVAGGLVREERVTLRRELDLPGYLCADLHVHTGHSPDADAHGGITAVDLLAEGLEVAVATDHNRPGTVAGPLDSLSGAEITTWDPEVGHFNAFPITRLPRWRKTSPRALLRELHEDPNVFVQVNHPRLDDHIAYFTLGEFDGKRFRNPEFSLHEVDGLEVYNGYDIAQPDKVRRLLGDWRRLLEAGHALTATGGSDSHGRSGHFAGYPRTCVEAKNAAGLPAALRQGRAFVTNGPLLLLQVEGKAPGHTAEVGADDAVEVALRVLIPRGVSVETLEVWAGDVEVWSQRLLPEDGQDIVRILRLPTHGARHMHAVLHGGSGLATLVGRNDVAPLSFTNAVRLVRMPATRPQSLALGATRRKP